MVDLTKYAPHDFDRMMFPVYGMAPGIDLFKRFPILNLYPCFSAELNHKVSRKGILRYIFFCFDMNSPLQTVDDIMQRRHEAALLAGFTYEKGTESFDADEEKILLSKDPIVNLMIIQFLALLRNDDFMTLLSFQSNLYSLNGKIMSGKYDAKDIANIKILREEIKILKRDMQIDTFDPLLRDSLYIFGEATRIKVSPESYARTLRVQPA